MPKYDISITLSGVSLWHLVCDVESYKDNRNQFCSPLLYRFKKLGEQDFSYYACFWFFWLSANIYGIFSDKLFWKTNIFDLKKLRKKIDFCPVFFRKIFPTFYISLLKNFHLF